jgi:hypothetical protein
VRRPSSEDGIARFAPAALELTRASAEVVDQLDEVRVIAHTLAQLAQYGIVECATQVAHVNILLREPTASAGLRI